jgi:hypothetical protein
LQWILNVPLSVSAIAIVGAVFWIVNVPDIVPPAKLSFNASAVSTYAFVVGLADALGVWTVTAPENAVAPETFTAPSVVVPVTARVEAKVAAPVCADVPDNVVLPVTSIVLSKVTAPLTLSVWPNTIGPAAV